MSTNPTSGTGGRTARARPGPHQWLALVIGAGYLVIGLAGFLETGFDDWTGHDMDETLLGFAVNPLHNVVHLVIGLAGVLLWTTSRGARVYGWALAIGYGATFVYGLIAIGEDWDILNINTADNWLHAVSALLGLLIALWPHRDADRTAAGADPGTTRLGR